MRKPELYIKDNGRYKPYVEPMPDDRDVLYRRVGRKYVPHSVLVPQDFLNDGVWVVSKHRSGYGYTAASHMRELFRCERVSDLKEVSVAELGGMEKLADHLQHHWNDIDKTLSISDQCRQIVGILCKYNEYHESNKKEL